MAAGQSSGGLLSGEWRSTFLERRLRGAGPGRCHSAGTQPHPLRRRRVRPQPGRGRGPAARPLLRPRHPWRPRAAARRTRLGGLRCTVGWEPERRIEAGAGSRDGGGAGGGPGAGLRLCGRRGAAMNAAVVKRTQEALGKVIRRPPLTEKLLNKPPFRYLHDIITEVSAGPGSELRSGPGPRARPGCGPGCGLGCRSGVGAHVGCRGAGRSPGCRSAVGVGVGVGRRGLGGSDQSWRRDRTSRLGALPLPEEPGLGGTDDPWATFPGSVPALGEHSYVFRPAPLLFLRLFFPCSVWQMESVYKSQEKDIILLLVPHPSFPPPAPAVVTPLLFRR